jgi:hypothetical protein
MAMKPDRYKKYLDEQIKLINDFKWCKGVELGKDPGPDAVREWVKKYAAKFRKDFAIHDLKEAHEELRAIRKDIESHMKIILGLMEYIDKCEEKLFEGVELLEKENGEANGSGFPDQGK